MGEPLLRTDQVAEYLGVPIQTIYAWRYRDFGPRALKLGRRLRWRLADVDRWLEEQARA